MTFTVPPTEIDHIALLTNLSWSNDVPDHTPVAQSSCSRRTERLSVLICGPATIVRMGLRSFATSERKIKHKRAPVGPATWSKMGGKI